MSIEEAREEFARLRVEAAETDRRTAVLREHSALLLARIEAEKSQNQREDELMARSGFASCGRCQRYVRIGLPFFGVHFCGG